jgi:hypothetical protein
MRDRMPNTELIDRLLDEQAKALAGVGTTARGRRLV